MASLLNGLTEKLRGARRIEWFAAVVLLALLALLLLNGAERPSDGRTALERRVERILSRIDGVGGVSAMINEEDGAVTGAVIVADGLSDVREYLELQGAVATLLDIDLSKIRIVGNGEAFGGER